MDIYFSFVLAALALAGSPGPNTLSLAAVGAAFGMRRGIGFMLGLNIGMFFVIIMVGSGVAGLLFLIPGAGQFVIVLAAIYFIFLAYKIATAPLFLRIIAKISHQPGLRRLWFLLQTRKLMPLWLPCFQGLS